MPASAASNITRVPEPGSRSTQAARARSAGPGRPFGPGVIGRDQHHQLVPGDDCETGSPRPPPAPR